VESRFRGSPIRQLMGILFMKLGGDGTKRYILRTPNGDMAGISRIIFRTKPGGVNAADIDLDPSHSEAARFSLTHAITIIQAISPGRRIEFEFKDWQPALLQSALSLGAKKRYGAHRMGLKFS
jgi:hypothetical protein